jgi:hypothetical protein
MPRRQRDDEMNEEPRGPRGRRSEAHPASRGAPTGGASRRGSDTDEDDEKEDEEKEAEEDADAADRPLGHDERDVARSGRGFDDQAGRTRAYSFEDTRATRDTSGRTPGPVRSSARTSAPGGRGTKPPAPRGRTPGRKSARKR